MTLSPWIIQHKYPKNKDIFLRNHNTINTSKNFNIDSMGNITFSILCIKKGVRMNVYWTQAHYLSFLSSRNAFPYIGVDFDIGWWYSHRMSWEDFPSFILSTEFMYRTFIQCFIEYVSETIQTWSFLIVRFHYPFIFNRYKVFNTISSWVIFVSCVVQ